MNEQEQAFLVVVDDVRADGQRLKREIEEVFDDVYVEVRGPAASDVHHNFTQRWNGASERGLADGAWPDLRSAGDLALPRFASPAAGAVPVQMTRTVMAGLYDGEAAAPGAAPFAIAQGEESALEHLRGRSALRSWPSPHRRSGRAGLIARRAVTRTVGRLPAALRYRIRGRQGR